MKEILGKNCDKQNNIKAKFIALEHPKNILKKIIERGLNLCCWNDADRLTVCLIYNLDFDCSQNMKLQKVSVSNMIWYFWWFTNVLLSVLWPLLCCVWSLMWSLIVWILALWTMIHSVIESTLIHWILIWREGREVDGRGCRVVVVKEDLVVLVLMVMICRKG